MRRGLLARLGLRSMPVLESPTANGDEALPAPEPAEAAPEPEPAAAPVAPSTGGLGGAPARPLPSFRPVGAKAEAEEAAPPQPLSLTLSEAIELVHEAGGDAMELRFLRRELQRRGGEGAEPPDLWARTEKAVAGRLRRVGRLAEGQALELSRDPR